MTLLRELSRNLLSRHGRISGRTYWINCAVLLCAGIVLHLLAFGFIYAVNPEMLLALNGVGVVVITFGLIALLFYPYLCLYAKRLRAVGRSPYWYLVVLLAYCVLFVAVPNAIYALTQTSPAELFVPQMNIVPALSEAEHVAIINKHSQKILIATAIFTAMVHGIITIAIDVVLGRMKPKTGQEILQDDMLAFV